MLYRILLFINTAVGHSVERVHALAQLYDEITLHVAQDMVAIWQALRPASQSTGTHRPLLANDKPGARLRSSGAARRRLLRRNERRSAS